MDRFYGDEPDNEQPFFEFEDDGLDELEQEAIAYIQPDLSEILPFQIAKTELKQDLVKKAADIASQSMTWELKSPAQKLKEIELIYQGLKSMTEEPEEEIIFEPTDEEESEE